jgi:hypothetical protein
MTIKKYAGVTFNESVIFIVIEGRSKRSFIVVLRAAG